MTPDEFEAALTSLGWKGRDFARKAGAVDNTIWRWRKGHTPIPQWVGEYLGAMLAIQGLHARFVAVSRPPGADSSGERGGVDGEPDAVSRTPEDGGSADMHQRAAAQ